MQVVVLVDVVGADDVRVVEGGDGAGLAVEAFEADGSSALAVGSTLTATRRRISLCSHRYTWPMPPDAEPLQHLVLADGEALPLALQELLGLEVGEEPSRTSRPGELARVGWQIADCRSTELLDVGREASLRRRPRFFSDQVEEFVGGRGRGHQYPLRSGRKCPKRRLRTRRLFGRRQV